MPLIKAFRMDGLGNKFIIVDRRKKSVNISKEKIIHFIDGKLLEITGSVDPVVVPQHSMSLLQEFVKTKIQVDFFSYPMHPHNVRGVDRVHLMRKVLNYIIINNQ